MLKTGLDRLLLSPELIPSGRIGLVSHSAAVTDHLIDSVSAFLSAGINLTSLFGPEHGFSSAAADGATVDHAMDPHTGLPVYSLYGKTKEPTPEMLSGIDTLLIDIQDVGVRFYTYLSTMYYCLTGCAKTHKKVVILDRPNPLNGMAVEGPMLNPSLTSFVGIINIPVRHGLTMGELAGLIVDKQHIPVDLDVISMQGWSRSMWFDQTGRTWVPTSPGMPHTSTTIVYPGVCFIEGTNLSEGRGTALPFEVIGAPWINEVDLAIRLNNEHFPGVHFRPTVFTPTSSKFAGETCKGIQLHVIDRDLFKPVETGLSIIQLIRNVYPEQLRFLSTSWEGKPPHFDLLCGNQSLRNAIELGGSLHDEFHIWYPELEQFSQTREQYLLY